MIYAKVITAAIAFVFFARPGYSFLCQCLDPLDNSTPDQFVTDVCCTLADGLASGVDCDVSLLDFPQLFQFCCEENNEETTCS